MNPGEEELMIRYLLGELPDQERTGLEDSYFAEDERFQRLLAVESELVDAYVRGELSASRRRAFEARLLVTEEQKRKVELARQLQRHAGEAAAAGAASAARPLWRWQWTAVAAMVLLLAGAAVWLRHAPAPSPPPQATQPAPNPPPQPQPVVASFVLSTEEVRAGGELPTLRIPASATVVRLELNYTGERYSGYAVVVRTAEGRQVWQRAGLEPQPPGAVVVEVPAPVLANDDYILTLRGGDKGGFEDAAEFSFRVKR